MVEKAHNNPCVHFCSKRTKKKKVQLNLKLGILKFNWKYVSVLIMSEGPRIICSETIRDSTDPSVEDN